MLNGEELLVLNILKVSTFSILAPEEMEFAPILGFQSVKYIAPVVYPDIIKIGTITEEI